MKYSMDRLVNCLKEQHISVTPQRLEILKNIISRYDHPSADSIYQEVRRHLPMISFNTVYKTLETFCQLGLITKINPLHEVARYDGNVAPHAHLVCTRCHKVEDFDWSWPDDIPLPDASPEGFKIESVSVQFFGLCQQCQQQ
ncbi:ferric uptake regulator, Fur family [Desulfobacca acetoxidans DSM 11109]|uniref:Ferric uptake regulator, Fur family n=2 Tax=Desulfobacca acetoxidans TaxID=60893 RepID=F2NHD5_DESAR|nr:ferric uptake regulator, Fur family [Desulfobacca acetoxidans DSM 11109]